MDLWRLQLLPASYRGVPFLVEQAQGEGGRRLDTHEFPWRDDPFTEDLGEAALRFQVRAYVVGDFYMQQRDALLGALAGVGGPGWLMLPWRAPLQARAGRVRWTEHKDQGGFCALDVEFVRDTGALPSPTIANSTASALLNGLASIQPLIANAYATAGVITGGVQAVLGTVTGLLGSAQGAFLALSQIALTGDTTITALAPGIAATPTDPSATATAVLAAFAAASDNLVAAAATPIPVDDPVAGLAPALPGTPDPSGGLASLGAWNASLAPSASPAIAAQQTAIINLVSDAATMATALTYAAIPWPTANAAAAARAQLATLIGDRAEAASDSGNADLYRGWRAVGALATSFFVRTAQALPVLQPYALGTALPSLTLANRLVQDAGQADALVALNAAIHPLFMPLAGSYVAASGAATAPGAPLGTTVAAPAARL